VIALGVASAQATSADAQVQQTLEALAVAVRQHVSPDSAIKKVEVGPRSLTLHLFTPEQADPSVLKGVLQSAGRPLCSDPNWSWFWSNGLTLHLVGQSASGAREAVEVTSQSCASSSAVEIVKSDPDALGFKVYWLGMSLDDFRRQPVPHPDGATMEKKCDVDSLNSPRLYAHIRQRISAGVVTCTIPQITLTERYGAYDSSYRFLDGQLAEINFQTNIDAYRSIVDGLTVKYGPGTSTVLKLQNAFGAEVSGIITTWARNGQLIEVRAPDGDVHTVGYRATDIAMAAEAESRINPPAEM
jgi:hypothetical protein